MIAQGTPEQVAAVADSHTGTFLAEVIDEYPELTLKDGDLKVSERLTYHGPGTDPERN